jgi:hypothetical protein
LWKVWRAPNGSKARQAERYDAVLQRLLQHQREKAAEHVAGLIEVVKDRDLDTSPKAASVPIRMFVWS